MNSPGGSAIAGAVLVLLAICVPTGFGFQKPSTLRVPVDLVSLNVTATDDEGRVMTGLQKNDFRIYEDGVEQTVSFFGTDEAPVSWGLVLDRSGSMFDMMENVYRAALHVMDEGTRTDEMFIVTFDDRVELVSDFTSDRRRLQNAITDLRAGRTTALYDAVARGLQQVRKGKHQKKVLVVVTDGEDNASEIGFRRLVDLVEEERDVLVYTVIQGVQGKNSHRLLRSRRRTARALLMAIAF